MASRAPTRCSPVRREETSGLRSVVKGYKLLHQLTPEFFILQAVPWTAHVVFDAGVCTSAVPWEQSGD